MKQRVWGAFLIVVLVAALVGGPVGAAAAGSSGPWAALVGPAFARFVPGTAEWDLRFGVVGDGWGTAQPKLVAVKAVVDGRACGPLQTAFTRGSWAVASGRLTLAEVNEVTSTRLADAQGIAPTSASLPRFEDRAAKLAALLGQAEPGTLSLGGMESLPAGSHDVHLNLTYDVGGKTVVLTTETVVLLAALPPSDGWYPADLHMHSTFSKPTDEFNNRDIAGLRDSLASRGYSIGYVTDHTSALIANQTFGSLTAPYPAACRSASSSTISMFPGVELGVTPEGHALGYGVISATGLPDNTLTAQTGLDSISGESAIASAAIAHPGHVFGIPSMAYPWVDQNSVNYRGVEVMSGDQYELDFTLNSLHARFWRAQCLRLLASGQSFVPSVRVGSDFHVDDPTGLVPGGWQDYVTYVQVPGDLDWATASWDDRWGAVSLALKNGRTVVSRKGSLAYLTLDGSPVGSFLPRVAGSQMTFDITLRPVDTGAYTLTLYRDDCGEVIQSWAFCPLEAGAPVTFSVDDTFPGGRHYYWLYVEESDYCYTTPIYVADEQSWDLSVNPDSLTVERGECLQLVANVSYGTERDVTDLVTWTSSDPSVCAVLGGVVRGGLPGQAVISADFGTAHAQCTVTVNPPDHEGLSFYSPPSYAVFDGYAEGADGATGDFNGDGRLDLAVAGQQVDAVSILLGGSGGTFQPAGQYPAGEAPCALVTADFDRDGKLDLAALNYTNPCGVSILLGNGDGSFRTTSTPLSAGYMPNDIEAVDLNGDGNMDLVVTNTSLSTLVGEMLVFTGHGDGTFAEPVSYAAGGLGYGRIASADFDGDGHADIAVACISYAYSGAGYVRLYLGDGAGGLAFHSERRFGSGVRGLWAGDLNGDTRPDLAVSYDNYYGPMRTDPVLDILINLGEGSFVRTVSRVNAQVCYGMAGGDFNSDGTTELAAIGAWNLSILSVGSDGALMSSNDLVAQGNWCAAGDFDLDGNGDLIAVSENNVAVFFRGLGNGQFEAPPGSTAGYASSAVASDLNGDGLMDLVVTNPTYPGHGLPPYVNGVSVFIARSWGTFETSLDYTTSVPPGSGCDPVRVVAGDFNHDTVPDIAVANSWNHSVVVLMGNGDGSLAPAVRYGAGGDDLVLSDFNVDGNVDLATAYTDGGKLSVLLGNGAGVFQSPLDIVIPNYHLKGIVAGDFNNDGYPDLVVRGFYEGGYYRPRLYLGNGDGTFTEGPCPAPLASGTYNLYSLISGDLNGDGNLDLIAGVFERTYEWPNVLDWLKVLLGQGDGTFHQGQVIAGSSLAKLLTDLNGDGCLDLVLPGSVIPGRGDGTFDTSAEVAIPNTLSYVGALASADFTGDGLPDLAVSPGAGTGGWMHRAFSVVVNTSIPTSGVRVIETGGSTVVREGCASDTYTVALTGRPAGDVTVTITSSLEGQVTLATGSPPSLAAATATLAFTQANWNVPQTVTVTAVDDTLAEGPHSVTLSHTATGGGYDGLVVDPVAVSIIDNDSPPVIIAETGGSTEVTEGGAGDSYTLALAFVPSGDVTVTAATSPSLTVTVARPGQTPGATTPLTFTMANWNVPQTVTVGAVNDAVAEGTHTGTITHTATGGGCDGLPPAILTVSVIDNDFLGLVLAQTGGSTAVTEGGAGDTYTVALATQPAGEVTVTLAGDGQVTATNATGGAELVFGPATWNVPQTVTVTAINDAVVEGPHSGAITHTASGDGYDGLAPLVLSVSITDNDAPTIIITETGGSTAVLEGPPGAEGTTDTYSVCLGAQPSGTVTVTAAADAGVVADNGLGGNTLVFTPTDWSVPQTLAARAVDDAIVEGPHSGRIVHTASGGAYASAPAVQVDVAIADDDLPTIVISETGGSTTVTEGGASDTYSMSLGAQPSGPVTIIATPDSPVTVDNGRGGNTLTFTTAKWSVPQSLTVRAVDDLVVEGLHAGRITHSASGGAYDLAAAVELTAVITDNDVLEAPRTLTAATSANGVRLGWQPPLGATIPTGYEVYIKTTSTGTATQVKDVTTWPGTTPNCEVTALDFVGTGFAFTSGRTYYFHLKAYVDSTLGPRVVSPVSNTAFTVAGPIPPLPPRGLTGAATATGLRLGWLPALTGYVPQGYQVFIAATTTGPFTLVKEVTSWSGTAPNCEVTQLDFADGSGGYTFTLAGGKRYAFQVRGFILPSVGGKPTSGPSNTATVTAGPLPPGAPTGLAARTTLLGVGLGWRPPLPTVTAPTPPTGYSVYIAVTSIGPWTFVKDVMTWTGDLPNTEVTGADLDGTGFTMTGGLRYAFRVFSFLTHPLTGQKVPSLMGATTMGVAGPLPPLAPTSLRGTTGADGFGLTWLAPLTGVTPQGYEVWMRPTAATTAPFVLVKEVLDASWSTATPSCDVTSAEIAAGGLAYTPGARYSVRLYAYALHPVTMEKLVSARWASSTVTAGPLPPQAPTSLVGTTALPASGGGVNLTWKPPTMGVVPAGYAVHIAAVSTGPYTSVRNVTSWSGTYPSTQVTAGDCAGVGFTMTAGVRYYFRVYSFIYHPVTHAEIPSLRFGVTSAIAGALP